MRTPMALKLWHVVVTFAAALALAACGIAVVLVGVLWLWRELL